MTRLLRTTLLCITCLSVLLIGVATEAATVPTQAQLLDQVGKPNPVVGIPGLEFSDPTLKEEQGDFYLYLPYLGDFIAAGYRYAIVVASLISVVVIILSGVTWLTSGGNVSQIGTAKKRIAGAIAGLSLAIGSYVVLASVNPEFTSFRSLRVEYIAGVGLDKFNEEVTDEPTPEEIAPHLISDMEVIQNAGETQLPDKFRTGLTYGFNGVPYFSQFDSRWGSTRYGDEEHCTTFTKAACGPTSFAMVLRHLGKDVNPTHLAKIAVETGARNCNSGTNSASQKFQNEIRKTYRVNILELKEPSQALEVLKKKEPLIISQRSEGYGITGKKKTYKGHFMVLTGVDKVELNGKEVEVIRVNDPGNQPYRGITYMTMEQFEQKDRFLYITNQEN